MLVFEFAFALVFVSDSGLLLRSALRTGSPIVLVTELEFELGFEMVSGSHSVSASVLKSALTSELLTVLQFAMVTESVSAMHSVSVSASHFAMVSVLRTLLVSALQFELQFGLCLVLQFVSKSLWPMMSRTHWMFEWTSQRATAMGNSMDRSKSIGKVRNPGWKSPQLRSNTSPQAVWSQGMSSTHNSSHHSHLRHSH